MLLPCYYSNGRRGSTGRIRDQSLSTRARSHRSLKAILLFNKIDKMEPSLLSAPRPCLDVSYSWSLNSLSIQSLFQWFSIQKLPSASSLSQRLNFATPSFPVSRMTGSGVYVESLAHLFIPSPVRIWRKDRDSEEAVYIGFLSSDYSLYTLFFLSLKRLRPSFKRRFLFL